MQISIRRTLQLAFLALAAASGIGFAVDYQAMRTLRVAIEKLGREDISHMATLKVISDAYAVTIVDATHKVAAGSVSWEEGRTSIVESRRLIEKSWAEFSAGALTVEERTVASEYEGMMAKGKPFLQSLEEAVNSMDRAKVAEIARKDLYPQIDPLTEKIDTLVKMQLKSAKEVLEGANDAGARAVLAQILVAMVLAVLTLLGIGFVSFKVIGPLDQVRQQMLRLAEGDARLALPKVDSASELGAMVETVQVFQQNHLECQRLEAVVREERQRELDRQRQVEKLVSNFRASISGVRGALDRQLGVMESSSASLSSIADSAAQSANVAQEATMDASGSAQQVASAASELTAASREISTQVHKAGDCVAEAISIARDADRDISGLAELSGRIGAIIDMIQNIAEQTNMLALNATIEAARAGDAGRSFAVVASEVKTLAGQTARATEEISTQVVAIQAATQQAVQSIRNITDTISQIEARSMAIAAAVEQQEASMHEIAGSLARISDGSTLVAENISNVTATVEQTNEQASSIGQTSNQLQSAAGELSISVDHFLSQIADDVRERRSVTRRAMLQASVILGRSRRCHTQVVAAAANDVTIEAVPEIELGGKLQLEWSNGQRSTGRVIWIGSEQAGIALDIAMPEELMSLARAA